MVLPIMILGPLFGPVLVLFRVKLVPSFILRCTCERPPGELILSVFDAAQATEATDISHTQTQTRRTRIRHHARPRSHPRAHTMVFRVPPACEFLHTLRVESSFCENEPYGFCMVFRLLLALLFPNFRIFLRWKIRYFRPPFFTCFLVGLF